MKHAPHDSRYLNKHLNNDIAKPISNPLCSSIYQSNKILDIIKLSTKEQTWINHKQLKLICAGRQ